MRNQAIKSARLRTGRRYLVNHYYHLTTTTRDRREIFTELYAVRRLVRCMSQEECQQTVHSIAYVVMPDHLHWLVQSLDGDIASVMRRVKARSSKALGGNVWQVGYHDRCLRKEEDIRQVARYIVANPLRAGLVERVHDYAHWDVCYL